MTLTGDKSAQELRRRRLLHQDSKSRGFDSIEFVGDRIGPLRTYLVRCAGSTRVQLVT